MGPLDWIIIAVYLIGCTAAGIWMRRYVRDVEDFAVAGREMDINLGVASLAATEVGIVTVMYTAQMGFSSGFAGGTPGVLIAVAMLMVGLTGFVIGPLRRAGVITIPELFEKRFGKHVRWLAGLVVVLGGVLNMGIFLRLGGEFLVHVTGLPAQYLEITMISLLAIVLVYTVLGGMLSVLVTDYIQFLVMGLGIVITSVLVIKSIGWPALVDGLMQAHQEGAVLVDTVKNESFKMGHPFDPFASPEIGWFWVLWQAVLALAIVTTWQTTIARVLSAKDDRTAKKVYRRTAFYFVGRFALPGLWGAAAFYYFWRQGGLPEGVNSLTAMPHYLNTLLPAGIIGIMIAAMLAAEMSTDSGYLLTWATVIYNDLVMPLMKTPPSPKVKLLVVRSLVVLIGLFLVFYGLLYEMPGRAWDYLAVTGNIYMASMFSLLVGSLYWKKANSWGAVASIILGAVGPITFLIYNAIVKNPAEQLKPETAGLAAFALAIGGMIVGSLIGHAMGRGVAGPIPGLMSEQEIK
ncbi:MAG: sodium:solute symporter family protein [Pirellulales bacterium]|nr:sodium:solute symporter family protein [Pirellulales bacterium]